MAVVLTGVFPAGKIGLAYSVGMVATGGTGPYTYSLVAGALPPGITLDASTGVVSGIPTGVAASYDVTFKVTDSLAVSSFNMPVTIVILTLPSTSVNGPNLIGDQLPSFIGQTTDRDLQSPGGGGQAGGTHIQLPPFKFGIGGDIYIAYTNISTEFHAASDNINNNFFLFTQFCCVAKSTDGGKTFATLDFAHAPGCSTSCSPQFKLDLANDRVLCMVIDPSGPRNDLLPSTLSLQAFNLTTGLWDAPVATNGPNCTSDGWISETNNNSFYNGTGDFRFEQISATKFCVVYFVDAGGGSVDLKSLILDTGVWGAPSTIKAHTATANPLILGTAIDATNRTHVLIYFKDAATADVLYNRVDSAGVVLGEISVLTGATFFPGSLTASRGVYLAGIDTVIFPVSSSDATEWTPNLPSTCCLIKVTPTNAPVITLEAILDLSASTDTFGPPYFYTSLGGTIYYAAFERVTSSGGPLGLGVETVEIYSRAAGGAPGVWTGPTVFYNATTQEPNGPLYPDTPDSINPPAELNSLAFTYFADGTLATTVGMLSDWCGVIFFMDQAPPSPSSFVPEFPSNPLPPPPFCAINEMVIGRVTTNGVDTSIVITDNMAVSAADLVRGLPTVEFEPLDANFGAIGPFVQAITSSTVTIGFAAVAGTFRVRIDKVNTVLR